MTRIRIIEWLLAVVVVVALHGVALTGWAWIAPADPGGVRLPPKTASTAATADVQVAAVPLVVKVAGEETAPAAQQDALQQSQPVASSNEIIVVPTTPTVTDNAGQSTMVVAKPDLAPPPAIEMPAETTNEPEEAAEAAAPPEPVRDQEAPAVAALQLPTLDEQKSVSTAETPTPLRDPVPVPKARPDAGGQPVAPPEPPAAERAPSESSQTVASTDPARNASSGGSESSEPFSAAQSTYYRRLLADIRKAQTYPESARRENMRGTVYMQIVVERSGRIKSYDIVKSSGFQELDEAAVQSLVRANPVAPFPDEIPEGELRFGLPMRFGS